MVRESTISSAPGGLREPRPPQAPLTRHRRRRTCGLGGPRARWKITASGPFESFHNVGMARDLDHDHQARGKGRCGTTSHADRWPGRSAAASWCRGGPGVSLHSEDHGLRPFRVVRQPWMAGDLDHDQGAQHDSKSDGTADPRRRQHQGTADPRPHQGTAGSVAHGAVDVRGRSALPNFRTPATGSRCYSSARVVLASVSSSANAPRIASSESLTCEASVTPSVSTPASAAVVLNSNSLA